MVDRFFSAPKKKSAKRRERIEANAAARRPTKKKLRQTQAEAEASDAEITSDSDSDVGGHQRMDEDEDDEEASGDEGFFETEADRRLRIAKEYIKNQADEAGVVDGIDAEELDREIIGSRLKEDIAEHKGRVYKYIADKLTLAEGQVKSRIQLMKPYGITAIATMYPHAFTVSKDMYLTKWDITTLQAPPRQVKFVRGNGNKKKQADYEGHSDEILCVAVSFDNKYVVTGGRDKKIVVWSTENLGFVKSFDMRDRKGVVMGLAFRRGTNELYAACADLKVRTFNLDQLAQVETLFGHQDHVADIAALGQERCVTVGSRDRTAIMWKISEESRLTFRSGIVKGSVFEGSIDCCSMIDDQLFVTGSDNGAIALWSLQKKKPVYIVREAHGCDEQTGESHVPAQPRYISTIHAVPYSDVFLTGSWSGEIKVWKLSKDQRTFAAVGAIPGVKGIVNKISTVEHGTKGKEDIAVYAAVSKEMRLGRWMKQKKGKNGIFSAVLHQS